MGDRLLVSSDLTISVMIRMLVDRVDVLGLRLSDQSFVMVMTQLTRSWSTFGLSIRQLSIDLAVQLQLQLLGVVLKDAHAVELDEHENNQVERDPEVPQWRQDVVAILVREHDLTRTVTDSLNRLARVRDEQDVDRKADRQDEAY